MPGAIEDPLSQQPELVLADPLILLRDARVQVHIVEIDLGAVGERKAGHQEHPEDGAERTRNELLVVEVER